MKRLFTEVLTWLMDDRNEAEPHRLATEGNEGQRETDERKTALLETMKVSHRSCSYFRSRH